MKFIKLRRLFLFLILITGSDLAFGANEEIANSWLHGTGVIGMFILVGMIVLVALIIFMARLNGFINRAKRKKLQEDKLQFEQEILTLKSGEIDDILEQRKAALSYQLSGKELGGEGKAVDKKGIIYEITHDPDPTFVAKKQRRSQFFLQTDPQLKRIVYLFIGAATFWLLFGTTVGEFAGMKFVWPEIDHASWLSFSRIRVVHTNTVFWGWGSFAMVGLAYFVISRTSNTKIYSYKLAIISFILFNLNILIGDLLLMGGINNGGGEFREIIWPVFVPCFIVPLIMTFINFYMTIARRTVKEIYISNWFIMASIIWTAVVATTAYLPINGLGETAIAGYFMHMGVGMWFMTFCLGLIYYYLPASLNKPIYSYALGVVALWTQMLFYTMIGTHHFIFSPLPWWLQSVAIVYSIGMVIPVTAGTVNYLMTMRGKWIGLTKSYVMPFFLVGVIFYWVGSMQGSLQATRYTNYVWHFTDFNVAHSHMTMYGIISFILWACIYYIVPRLTGREPRQFLVGGHFWLAFIGLFAYSIPLMIGGTLKGLSWLEGQPFIKSVILMRPYWVWRAVGGSLMLLSHFIFAYNIYYMFKGRKADEVHAQLDTELESGNLNLKTA